MKTSATNPFFSKFKFLSDDWFGRYSNIKNQPCYRTIICWVIFQYFKNTDEVSAVRELSKLASSYKNISSQSSDNRMYYLEEYLELYAIKFTSTEIGYLLVDKTGGIFPLVLYPYANSSYNNINNKERAKGFRASLDDLGKLKVKIVEEFKKYEDWNIELQNNLQKLFNSSSRGKSNQAAA